ncbi:hypothetical protein [Nocardiopsis coralliicola]
MISSTWQICPNCGTREFLTTLRRDMLFFLVVAVIFLQISIPLFRQISNEGHWARFSWSMFSGKAAASSIVVVHEDGSRSLLAGGLGGSNRSGSVVGPSVVQRACSDIEGAVEVRAVRPHGESVYPCGA